MSLKEFKNNYLKPSQDQDGVISAEELQGCLTAIGHIVESNDPARVNKETRLPFLLSISFPPISPVMYLYLETVNNTSLKCFSAFIKPFFWTFSVEKEGLLGTWRFRGCVDLNGISTRKHNECEMCDKQSGKCDEIDIYCRTFPTTLCDVIGSLLPSDESQGILSTHIPP